MTGANILDIDASLLTTVPEFFANEDRGTLFNRLRKEGPVFFQESSALRQCRRHESVR